MPRRINLEVRVAAAGLAEWKYFFVSLAYIGIAGHHSRREVVPLMELPSYRDNI